MGIGQTTSKYLSASVVWLLKDGAGMMGRILFAWGFAASFDADCKRWHYLGDILNDVACILDLITPHFRSALLFISSISNICRAVTGVIHGSTRTVIFQVRANASAQIAFYRECHLIRWSSSIKRVTIISPTSPRNHPVWKPVRHRHGFRSRTV